MLWLCEEWSGTSIPLHPKRVLAPRYRNGVYSVSSNKKENEEENKKGSLSFRSANQRWADGFRASKVNASRFTALFVFLRYHCFGACKFTEWSLVMQDGRVSLPFHPPLFHSNGMVESVPIGIQ